jgi:hypothetical protein
MIMYIAEFGSVAHIEKVTAELARLLRANYIHLSKGASGAMYTCFFDGSQEEPFRAIRLCVIGLLVCLYTACRRKTKTK